MNEQMRLAIGVEMLDEMEQNNRTIDQIVKSGAISRSLGKYMGQLLIIDFAVWEARQYAQQKLFDNAVTSLIDAKCALDGVALSLMFPNREEKRTNLTLYSVQPVLSKPISDNKKALYNLAKGRYEEAVEEVEKTFRSAA